MSNPSAIPNNHALYNILYSYTETTAEARLLTTWFHATRRTMDDEAFTSLLAVALVDGLTYHHWPWKK